MPVAGLGRSAGGFSGKMKEARLRAAAGVAITDDARRKVEASGRAADVVAGRALGIFADVEQIMALFGAEMRNIDMGGGVGGQKRDLSTRRGGGQRLAQAQNRQRAEQITGVDDLRRSGRDGHGGGASVTRGSRLRDCAALVRDGRQWGV